MTIHTVATRAHNCTRKSSSSCLELQARRESANNMRTAQAIALHCIAYEGITNKHVQTLKEFSVKEPVNLVSKLSIN